MNEEIEADKTLDATGLYCPEPVMMLHNVVKDVLVGQIIKVVATDPSTQRDIPKFCNFLEHELIAHSIVDEQFLFFIRKGCSASE